MGTQGGREGEGPPPGQDLLPGVVERLTQEAVGLRRALRHRAVLEQAKGILAERHGIHPEEAFRLLVEVSRQRNVKVIEVAASVLPSRPEAAGGGADAEGGTGSGGDAPGADVPVRRRPAVVTPPRAARRQRARQPQGLDPAGAGRRRLELARAEIAAAESADELVAAATRGCAWPRPADRGVLLRLEADGALDLEAHQGIAQSVASAWRRIPPGMDFPATVAARLRVPVFCPDPDEARARYASLHDAVDPGSFSDLPLVTRGQLLGVLGLGWVEHTDFDDDDRAGQVAIAQAVADRWHELGTSAGSEGAPALVGPRSQSSAVFAAMAELTPDALIVLTPVLTGPPVEDEGGARPGPDVADFRIDWVNARAAEMIGLAADEIRGRTLLELFPHASSSAQWWHAYVETLWTGRGHTVLSVPAPGSADAWGPLEVRVARLWDGLVVSLRALG